MNAPMNAPIDKEDVLSAMQGQYIDFYESQGGTVLKRDGAEYRGICPLHKGQRSNFTVNPDDGHWYCHSQGCGNPGGDIFVFVMLLHGVDFTQALATVAAWAGVSTAVPDLARRPLATKIALSKPAAPPAPPRLLGTALADDLHQTLLNSPKMLDWLSRERGWTQEAIERFKIGLLMPEEKGGEYRVTFPVFDSLGDLVNVRKHLFAYLPKYDDECRRKLGKTKPWDTGLGTALFPLSALTDTDTVLLVEGEADAVLGNALGIPTVSGTLGAGNWKQAWTTSLSGKCVTVLYDGDEAGDKGRLKPSLDLSTAGIEVRTAHFPDGIKDLTEWVVKHGATADDVRAAMDAAVPFAPPQQPTITDPTREAEEAPTDDTHVIIRDDWPEPLADAAYHGLAGEIVRAIEPHTEADPAALLIQFLVAFGSAAGRNAHFTAEADKHYGNLFTVLVGQSSKARKGSSLGQVRRLIGAAAPEWDANCVQSGLSSGEGLIHAVRDPVEKEEKNRKTGEMETVIVDKGVSDKRLLVTESEFASVLRQTQRDGNTLSAIVRNMWDGKKAQSMTKTNSEQATDPHVSIIGHITSDELRKDLAQTETANGFGNRFLWLCVRRSKELPDGGQIDKVDFDPMVKRLTEALDHARTSTIFQRDATAREIWHAVYHDLSSSKPGLLGAMTGRAESQVMRIALLYALLDCDTAIRAKHLTAALALWEYCEASARHIFGDSLGSPVADTILKALHGKAEGMSREAIRELFKNHQSSERIAQALQLLTDAGLARHEKHATAGRPTEVWFAVV